MLFTGIKRETDIYLVHNITKILTPLHTSLSAAQQGLVYVTPSTEFIQTEQSMKRTNDTTQQKMRCNLTV